MCPILQNLPFKYSAHWKQQGITYLQYLGLNTKAVRGCLKESLAGKSATRSVINYNRTYKDGERENITSMYTHVHKVVLPTTEAAAK